MFKNTKLNKTYNFLLKLLIISTSFGYIIYQLFFNENYRKVFNAFVSDFSSRSLSFILIFMLFMMLINWSIEAYKWRFLINKIEKISFAKAFKAILAGLSVSTFSPNRIGDFLGRVFILQKANPWKAIFISVLCSMSQLMITLFMGSLCLIIYLLLFIHKQDVFSANLLWVFIGLLLFANFLLFSVFFNVSFISKLLYKIINDKWIKIKKYLRVYSYFKFTELRNVLLFSLLRYMVFCSQFYFLLRFFGVPIQLYEGFMIIALIYFILSVIPSMTLAEIGIRGSVAVAVFDYYFNSTLKMNVNYNFGIVAATSVLWLINIALPALIGNLFVLKLRFFKEK